MILTYGFSDGELVFDATLPITDATGTIHTPVVSLYHAFGLFGRSANVTGSLPFALGELRGNVAGEDRTAIRRGLADTAGAACRQHRWRPGVVGGGIRQDAAASRASWAPASRSSRRPASTIRHG